MKHFLYTISNFEITLDNQFQKFLDYLGDQIVYFPFRKFKDCLMFLINNKRALATSKITSNKTLLIALEAHHRNIIIYFSPE